MQIVPQAKKERSEKQENRSLKEKSRRGSCETFILDLLEKKTGCSTGQIPTASQSTRRIDGCPCIERAADYSDHDAKSEPGFFTIAV